MKRTINFDDIKDTFQLLPLGLNELLITEYEEKISKNGNEMDIFKCENEDKIETTIYITQTEKAMWIVKAFCKAVGLKTVGTVEVPMERLVGKTLTVNVTHVDEQYADPISGEFKTIKKAKLEFLPKEN